MKHIAIYIILSSIIGYLFIQNKTLSSKNVEADSLLNKSINIIHSNNHYLLSNIEDVKGDLSLNSDKLKKIDNLNRKCNDYNGNDIYKEVSMNIVLHDSLLSLSQNFSICSPKFDSKYIISRIIRNNQDQYYEGDTAFFAFGLMTHSYVLKNTWTILGCSNPNVKWNKIQKYYELKIPTIGFIKGNQKQVHIHKAVEFYVKNNYTQTLDTLPSGYEFYVNKKSN